MGKPQVPPNDPQRLARVQNEKLRMIGVDKEALHLQIEERKASEAREREESRAYGQAASWMEQQVLSQHAQVSQQRRAVNQAVDAARRQQEEERQAREAAARQAEAEANAAEQRAALESPFLNEDPGYGVSAAAPRRVRRDHWKGFSPAQHGEVLAGQAAQVEARRASQEAARQAAEAAHAQQQAVLAALAQHAAAAQAAQKQEQARMAAELQRLAAEKRAREAALNKTYDTNRPTDAYFGQWGTSHR